MSAPVRLTLLLALVLGGLTACVSPAPPPAPAEPTPAPASPTPLPPPPPTQTVAPPPTPVPVPTLVARTAPVPPRVFDTLPARPSPSPLPSIKHVVVLYQENHTFDNYFASFPGTNGLTLQQLPHCTDLVTPPGSRCQYVESDLPYYWSLARQFGISDNFFLEVDGPSFPNHSILYTATTPALDNPPTGWGCPDMCVETPNVLDSLSAKGHTWEIYAGVPGTPGWDTAYSIRSIYAAREQHPLRTGQQLFDDIAQNRLPSVAWVKPPYFLSEHPAGGEQGWSVRAGESWVQRIVTAVQHSPAWQDTVIFITWDDAGGLYDHVRPPVLEELRDASGLTAARYGARIPLLVVSPHVQAGTVSHVPASQLGITRFVERLFDLPPLNARDVAAWDLSDFFHPVSANAPAAATSEPVRSNLLENPSLETPGDRGKPIPKGWSVTKDVPGVGQDCAGAHDGTCAVRILATGGGYYLSQSLFDLVGEGGDTYEFSGWSKAQGADGADYRLAVIVRDNSGQQLFQDVKFTPGDHDWEQATVRVTTKGPYAQIDVYARYGANQGTVWFDDLTLRKVNPDSPATAP